MADNNTGTLFHFTKSSSILKKILNEGFRITYCKEEFEDSFLGIPMISFCDIPLSRTDQHKKAYGRYAIGLDKEKLLLDQILKHLLNPVVYCHAANLANSLTAFKKEYEQLQSDIAERTKKDERYPSILFAHSDSVGAILGKTAKVERIKNLSNSILGFTKPYEGNIIVKGKEQKITYYNEREWRIVIPDQDCKWLNKTEYNEWRGDIETPKKFLDAVLKFDVDYVTHLIVDQESTIPSLVNHIWKSKSLFGNDDFDEKQKRILISRITSFQRIRKDY